MKTAIISTILLGFFTHLQGQITFQKAFGGSGMDEGNCVRQTTDGGYIIAGTTTSFGAGGRDVLVLKTTAAGDTVWTKTFGGDIDNEYGFCVQQTSDGGYIVSGVAHSFADVSGDMYIIKLTASGDTIWTRTFGGIGYEWGAYIQQTADGGYIVVGQTPAFGAGGFDAYLVKIDGQGNFVWSKTYGGSGLEIGSSVQQTADGGYILSGQIDTYGAGFGDFYLIKTNALGTVEWTRAMGVSGEESGVTVRQTADGGYIVGGSSENSGFLGKDMCAIKTNSAGDILWAFLYGGSKIDECYEINQTNDGGYILCGKSFSFSADGDYDVYVVKINSQGAVEWSKTYGASGNGTKNDIGYSIQQTADGGYIIAGESLFGFGVGLKNLYLIKTDAQGNSGCNEAVPATNTAAFSPQVIAPPTLVASGGTLHYPATIVHSGAIQTDLCATNQATEATPEDERVRIFPNPFTQNLTVSLGENTAWMRLDLCDMLGRVVFSAAFSEREPALESRTINLSALENGVYFCKITTSNGHFTAPIWKIEGL